MPQLLKDIVVEEVTFCSKGMNPGAKISLFKMEKSEPKTFDQIFVDPEVMEEKHEATDQLWSMTNALYDSFTSIAFNTEVDESEKEKMLNESMKEFNNAVKGIVDPLSKNNEGDLDMTKEELKKILDKLKLSKEAVAVVEQLQDSLEKSQATVAEMEKKMEKAIADAVAKAQEELKKEDAKDETDPLEKAKKEGASEEILKTIKKMQDDAKVDSERLAKMEKANLRKSYTERSEIIKAVGSAPEEVADVLMKIEDSETVEKVFDILTKSAKAVQESGLLKVLGKNDANELDGSAAILAKAEGMADELKKAEPSLTKERALSKIWKENTVMYKEYDTLRKKEARA